MQMAKLYDTKCYELAESFLTDMLLPGTEQHKKECNELAAYIQTAIEDWIGDNIPMNRR